MLSCLCNKYILYSLTLAKRDTEIFCNGLGPLCFLVHLSEMVLLMNRVRHINILLLHRLCYINDIKHLTAAIELLSWFAPSYNVGKRSLKRITVSVIEFEPAAFDQGVLEVAGVQERKHALGIL